MSVLYAIETDVAAALWCSRCVDCVAVVRILQSSLSRTQALEVEVNGV
jgi:hypothetical protein